MGKRLADAASRRFLDEFESVKVGRFRALGVIDPAKRTASIPWPSGKVKLLGVGHTKLKYGGGWSFFVCPRCAKLAAKLYDIDDQPLCWKCCAAMNIRHRSSHGFGREARRQASDQALDQIIAKLETTEPLRLKTPASWEGKAQRVTNSRRLIQRMRRQMITLRLGQLAQQGQAQGGLKITRAFKPSPQALAAIPELQQVWRARTHETLARALDAAQTAVVDALQSNDPHKQIIAARIMLRSKQGRERGFSTGIRT